MYDSMSNKQYKNPSAPRKGGKHRRVLAWFRWDADACYMAGNLCISLH
jgi:hypothetical protein